VVVEDLNGRNVSPKNSKDYMRVATGGVGVIKRMALTVVDTVIVSVAISR